MNELAEFLAARVDEAEATARKAPLRYWRERALRMVEACRGVLATIGALELAEPTYADLLRRELAVIWNDHPDYDQEWAP